MKANIPISSRMRKQLELAVREELQKGQYAATQRIFKLFCYVLHSKYGFSKRCYIVIDEVRKLIEEQDENPVFWEQLDRYVIDQMGIPFDREKVDMDGNLKRG